MSISTTRTPGLDKLAKDAEVGHLFFDYFDNLNEVDLRYLHGSDMTEFFGRWLDEYPDPYPQRYRKSIPYGFVREHGALLMTLKNGEVVFPALSVGETPTGIDRESCEPDQ